MFEWVGVNNQRRKNLKVNEYHNYNSCNKCGKDNDWLITSVLDSQVAECHTTCNHCGFEDYWAYGWYESGQDGYNSCSKYTTKQCKI